MCARQDNTGWQAIGSLSALILVNVAASRKGRTNPLAASDGVPARGVSAHVRRMESGGRAGAFAPRPSWEETPKEGVTGHRRGMRGAVPPVVIRHNMCRMGIEVATSSAWTGPNDKNLTFRHRSRSSARVISHPVALGRGWSVGQVFG